MIVLAPAQMAVAGRWDAGRWECRDAWPSWNGGIFVIQRMEIGTAYPELSDPLEQRRRLTEQPLKDPAATRKR